MSVNETSIKLDTFDAMSAKNKDSYILDIIINETIQTELVTETWFKDSDKIWHAALDLNKKGYKLSNINRKINRKEELDCYMTKQSE